MAPRTSPHPAPGCARTGRVRTTLSRAALAPLLALALLLAWPAAPAPAQDAREIKQIAEDLYRFRNNNHYSVFLVTEAGILATDPINAEAAAWLEGEMQRRFGQPVRYLIYSHSHGDHISGGEVFADTATVIAHTQAKREIVEGGVPTAVPDLTFTESMTVSLGGRTVELRYLGRSHSDNLIVMHFPEQRTVFAVDFVAAERMPYRDFPDAYLDDWIDALRALEAMDYDILATAHGEMGKPGHVTAQRIYMEKLRAAVADAIARGLSDEEIVRTVKMEDYRDWGQYEAWGELNVRGMIRHLRQPN